MKVIVVNHGYPPIYNAGSEIYTRHLVNGLIQKKVEVTVFSRIENPFYKDFEMISREKLTPDGKKYILNLVNVARQKDRYQSDGVDLQFKELVDKFNPDLIHFNHLNHLSLGVIKIAKEAGVKIIFTLHDFWLACPRGQFLQINYGALDPYVLCDGQENKKCAVACYSRYFSGLDEIEDVHYWTNWVGKRQEKIHEIVQCVDLFITPSKFLGARMTKEIGIDEDKLVYLDYGFDLGSLSGRKRIRGESVVFGYIGTHIVAKGLHLLIEAFSKLQGNASLLIFGRERSETTPYLKEMTKGLRIKWMPEYDNSKIVEEVFDKVDAIIVPSIWYENSPLVIHEGLQTKTLVITANAGGMSEYIHDNINGLTFDHRDPISLRNVMQDVINNPSIIDKLGNRGYLGTANGNVLSLDEHVSRIITIYRRLLE